jgi:hypothetical protein
MKIILPLSITLPRKKGDRVWILNLNSYRNTHFHVLNQAKVAWKSVAGKGIVNGDISNVYPYRFTYTVFPSSNRKFDLANVLSIIQKFTDDALIEFGIIPDDSYKIIPEIDYRFGGVDKDNPRCELEITSIETAQQKGRYDAKS